MYTAFAQMRSRDRKAPLGLTRARALGTTALSVAVCLALGVGAANAKGGTAKPPAGGGGAAPPPAGSCPTGGPATSACILPPAGPVLPNFPALGAALSGNLSNGFSISGHVQNVTGPACPAGSTAAPSTAGGTVTVNSIVITIPSDTIVQYPANTLTWGDAICGINALARDGTGGTAPAIYPGVEIRVDGNIVAPAGAAAGIGSPHIGSLVYISQHSVNSGSGYISAITYTTGAISVSTTGGFATLLLNDPKGRYGIPQSSPDARFSVDDANPTIKTGASGYPMCVPRSAPPAAGAAETDPLCPQKNRPTSNCRNFGASGIAFRIAGADLATTPINGFCAGFVMKALANYPGSVNAATTGSVVAGVNSNIAGPADPDPRQMAPFEVGDFITWQGTLVQTAGSPASSAVIWVHSIDANVGIYTQPGTLPAYIAVGGLGIGVNPQSAAAVALAGVEATARLVVEANTSDVASIVDFYLDDKGFSLPAGAKALVPDTAGATANEYFRWLTPESMTGTLADQASVLAKGVVVVPTSLVSQASAFGGGIYTQFIGPQPGRARIRAIKVPAIDATLACPATGTSIGGTQGCAITQSPTRYIRAALRSLCAPAATGAASATTDGAGNAIATIATVTAKNLDDGSASASPNQGRFFDINGARTNLTGAGPGLSGVLAGDGTCLQSAQFANGLFTGQYMAPVGEFIFPENTIAGFPIIPNNLWHLGFLARGENGRDGNSTAPQSPLPW